MIKKNLKILIITSIIMLLPVLFGLIMWNKLPDSLATHWGANGETNGYSSKAFCIFGMPLILLALQWVCAIVTAHDPKNIKNNEAVWKMIIWLCPILSIIIHFVIFSYAFGLKINMNYLFALIIGSLFLFLSRNMTKTKPNRTIGIRIKWTLKNEENWKATHRFASKLWFISGILILLSLLLPPYIMTYFTGSLLMISVLAPIIYSFIKSKQL